MSSPQTSLSTERRIAALLEESNDADTIEHWMTSSLGALESATPRELIAAGQAERVLQLVHDLRRGISGTLR